MSFDLGVWNSESGTGKYSAARIYESLCKGKRPAELTASPAVAAFYEELTSSWPETDKARKKLVNEKDCCPWSCALNRSDAHVLMACEWSKAEEVYAFVQELARRHGLVLFDPQSEDVFLPGEMEEKEL